MSSRSLHHYDEPRFPRWLGCGVPHLLIQLAGAVLDHPDQTQLVADGADGPEGSNSNADEASQGCTSCITTLKMAIVPIFCQRAHSCLRERILRMRMHPW